MARGTVKHQPAVADPRIYLDPLPKLYVYDHCPYCIKPRMILGLKQIKYDLIFFANDDFEGPINLIGKKAVPILETHHTGERVVMPESMDIVHHIDKSAHFQAGDAIVKPSSKAEVKNKVTDLVATPEIKLCVTLRTPRLSTLPEFHSKYARETYVARHPLKDGRNFEQAWEDDAQRLEKIRTEIPKAVEEVLVGPFAEGDELTDTDFMLFPWLRNMSCIKDFPFGPKALKYMTMMSEKCDIPLYSEIAQC